MGATGAGAVALLAIVVLTTACQEDMGQDAWIKVDNRADERVYIDYSSASGDAPDDDVLGWFEAHEEGLLPVDACGTAALEARMGATDGPVIATRSAADAQGCAAAWVIDP